MTTTPDPVAQATTLLKEVWAGLESALAGKGAAFPREILWLNGAPGAGKGTNTRTIMQVTGIKTEPVVISDLLSAPEFVAIKNSGGLVGDRDVILLLAKKLLDPAYRDGVIIDGFPRSRAQAEFLRMFHRKISESGKGAPPPVFRIVVLDVPMTIAVERQLKRGREALAANAEVERTGKGVKTELRATDTDPEAAKKRYTVFQEQTVGALRSIQDTFPYHHIDASGDIPTVAARITAELGKR
jgi:adenylate kinase